MHLALARAACAIGRMGTSAAAAAKTTATVDGCAAGVSCSAEAIADSPNGDASTKAVCGAAPAAAGAAARTAAAGAARARATGAGVASAAAAETAAARAAAA